MTEDEAIKRDIISDRCAWVEGSTKCQAEVRWVTSMGIGPWMAKVPLCEEHRHKWDDYCAAIRIGAIMIGHIAFSHHVYPTNRKLDAILESASKEPLCIVCKRPVSLCEGHGEPAPPA